MMPKNLSFHDRGSIYEASHEESSYPEVTLPYLSFASISMTVSNLLLVTILAYLKNLSLAKQCLLLCLYKDLVALWICMNSSWEIRIILSYSTGHGQGIDDVLSVVLSFCLWCVIGLSLLLMNVIAALKLYISKTNTLDPPMPWGTTKILAWISFGLPAHYLSLDLPPCCTDLASIRKSIICFQESNLLIHLGNREPLLFSPWCY